MMAVRRIRKIRRREELRQEKAEKRPFPVPAEEPAGHPAGPGYAEYGRMLHGYGAEPPASPVPHRYGAESPAPPVPRRHRPEPPAPPAPPFPPHALHRGGVHVPPVHHNMLRLEYDSAYEELFGSQADLVRRIMEHAPAERKLEFALITGLPVTFCGELFPREAPVRFASPLLTDEGVEAIAGSSGLPREAVREILENAPYEAAAIALAAAYCLTAESAWEPTCESAGELKNRPEEWSADRFCRELRKERPDESGGGPESRSAGGLRGGRPKEEIPWEFCDEQEKMFSDEANGGLKSGICGGRADGEPEDAVCEDFEKNEKNGKCGEEAAEK